MCVCMCVCVCVCVCARARARKWLLVIRRVGNGLVTCLLPPLLPPRLVLCLWTAITTHPNTFFSLRLFSFLFFSFLFFSPTSAGLGAPTKIRQSFFFSFFFFFCLCLCFWLSSRASNVNVATMMAKRC